MFFKLLKNVIFFIAAFVTLLSLSCCGVYDDVLIGETASQAAANAEAETTANETAEEAAIFETASKGTAIQTLSDEELETLSQNMPEIVFIAAHHLIGDNIVGLYITNTGELKMFDFRQIAPNKTYALPDVYDRLEEAACSEINFYPDYPDSKPDTILTEEHLVNVPYDKLVESYGLLNQMEEPAKVRWLGIYTGYGEGIQEYYGVRNNASGEKELILLRVDGEDPDRGSYLSKSLIGDELVYEHLNGYLCSFLALNANSVFAKWGV